MTEIVITCHDDFLQRVDGPEGYWMNIFNGWSYDLVEGDRNGCDRASTRPSAYLMNGQFLVLCDSLWEQVATTGGLTVGPRRYENYNGFQIGILRSASSVLLRELLHAGSVAYLANGRYSHARGNNDPYAGLLVTKVCHSSRQSIPRDRWFNDQGLWLVQVLSACSIR